MLDQSRIDILQTLFGVLLAVGLPLMLSRHKRVGLALSIVGGIGLLALLLLPKPESATKSEIASATSNQGVITQGQTGGTNIGNAVQDPQSNVCSFN